MKASAQRADALKIFVFNDLFVKKKMGFCFLKVLEYVFFVAFI